MFGLRSSVNDCAVILTLDSHIDDHSMHVKSLYLKLAISASQDVPSLLVQPIHVQTFASLDRIVLYRVVVHLEQAKVVTWRQFDRHEVELYIVVEVLDLL